MHAALQRLHALRGHFGASAAREKAMLVRSSTGDRWPDAESLARWHDELLFLAAFPDSALVYDTATAALDRIGRRVRELPEVERASLADSGLAGTETTHTFMFGSARWLAGHGESLTFAWNDEADAERLDTLLRLTLTNAESDRFDSGDVGSHEWMGEASASLRGGRAAWLLSEAPADAIGAAGDAWRAQYDAADVPLRWVLGDSALSASRNRLKSSPRITRTGLRTLPADPIAAIERPLPGIRRASRAEAARWHDASLAALVARAREVFPTIYANHREVHLAPLGEGTVLCILGVAPEDRSALEANYGYVMFANGVPVGYGGVTLLGAQANTGANLFEGFRRSEAPFLFLQSLRAFRTLFGVSRFVVNPYQFGADNEEAIASGAYWFYDRLGFRPSEPRLAALATRERESIARDRAHRSTHRTLRSLAGGDLVLELAVAAQKELVPERVLLDAGALATRAMSRVPAGARPAWIETEGRALLRRCTGERRTLTAAELRGARLLVPILAPLASGIARWHAADRRALWRLVALKGAAQELGFARAATRLAPLWRALRARARRLVVTKS